MPSAGSGRHSEGGWGSERGGGHMVGGGTGGDP